MQIESKTNFNVRSGLTLIAPFFLWGTAMVAMKGVLADTTPFFVATVRLIPAGILVLLWAMGQKRPQPQDWQGWGWIILFALVDGTLFQGFLAQGLERTGAGLGSVIIDSQPIAVALLSSWLFKEVIGGLGWLGLLLGVGGISLIGLPDEWFYQLWHLQSLTIDWSRSAVLDSGELWMLLASLSMAVGTVLIPFVSRRVDPVVATGWHMIIGGLPLLAIALVEDPQPWRHIDLWGWGNLAYATVFGSAIAYGIFFYLASRGNLTSLSSLTFLTPIFALSFGNLILGEQLSALQWLGVAFTLVSIYLINQRERLKIQLRAMWSSVRKPVVND
ncbi:DMT family transporter [Synechocystis salina LEGE 06099]|uniref:DMT family transporter n=1 Tax=Synechocystis salina TaxID=945780 RepID=UPI00187EEB9F|nr:DMT family transporter [Synechocystis salina]MBE9203737.1 DMT family transporter [Synechocystis salina LEGE 06099]